MKPPVINSPNEALVRWFQAVFELLDEIPVDALTEKDATKKRASSKGSPSDVLKTNGKEGNSLEL